MPTGVPCNDLLNSRTSSVLLNGAARSCCWTLLLNTVVPLLLPLFLLMLLFLLLLLLLLLLLWHSASNPTAQQCCWSCPVRCWRQTLQELRAHCHHTCTSLCELHVALHFKHYQTHHVHTHCNPLCHAKALVTFVIVVSWSPACRATQAASRPVILGTMGNLSTGWCLGTLRQAMDKVELLSPLMTPKTEDCQISHISSVLTFCCKFTYHFVGFAASQDNASFLYVTHPPHMCVCMYISISISTCCRAD